MRVTTELWVSAIVRRVFSAGGFATVARRGATEAGAVMIVLRDRLGEVRVFAPAPQTSYGDGRPDDRLFAEVLRTFEEEEVQGRIDRELRFDSDLWVIDLDVQQSLFAEIVPVTTL